MPRKNVYDHLTPVTSLAIPRVEVPPSINPEVRDAMVEIVNASPADAFKACDVPLIQRLAQTRLAIKQASETADYVNLARLELALCRALRLMPLSRLDGRRASTINAKPQTKRPWDLE